MALAGLDESELAELEESASDALSRIQERRRDELESRFEEARARQQCIICMDAERAVVFMPCAHLVTCQQCGSRPQMHHCPLCSRQIEQRLSIFVA